MTTRKSVAVGRAGPSQLSMWTRIAAAVTTAWFVGTSLVSTAIAAEVAPDLAGTELTMWTVASDNDAQKAMYQRFQDETGIKMTVVPMPADGFENAVADALGHRGAPGHHGVARCLQPVAGAQRGGELP